MDAQVRTRRSRYFELALLISHSPLARAKQNHSRTTLWIGTSAVAAAAVKSRFLRRKRLLAAASDPGQNFFRLPPGTRQLQDSRNACDSYQRSLRAWPERCAKRFGCSIRISQFQKLSPGERPRSGTSTLVVSLLQTRTACRHRRTA
jgi:hypothetical protein